MNSLISVIVPYYNSENYIRRCIESIVSQSYRDLEILLVNDGSEDQSPSIVEKMAEEDDRIVPLLVPHGGVSSARNAGLARATGTYVTFVDSDDWLRPGVLEQMIRLMEREEADLVTCDLERAEKMEPASSFGDPKVEICSREEYLRLFFKIDSNEWVHFPVAKLYRKSLLPLPLYPPGIRVGEDVLGTYLAIAQTGRIVRIRETGYYYFTNPQSTTSRFTEKDFDLLSVWDQVVEVTRGVEPDHSYARLNRNRINFTLLFRMITELPAREIKARYTKQQEQLRRDLRGCEKELLQSPIVISRKVFIFILCHFFPAAAFFGNLFVRIRLSRGEEAGVSRRRLS